MSVITLDGEIIHYEVLGRGRPLIFLHGWVGSWRYWVPTMQAASISYRAYAMDLWGFGETAKRPQKYPLQNQMELLNNFVENLGIGKIALAGHGLGAAVALIFTQHYPAVVDRVMLTGLPLGAYDVNPRIRSLPLVELADWLLSNLPAMEAARLEAPKADPQAILTSLDSLQEINVLELIQNLVTPCLLVYGQNDPAIQLPALEIQEKLSESSHVITFEQSGHFPMLDEPNKYNRLLGDFLSLGSGESPRQLQLKEEWKRRVR